jgi:hypothetical protein
MPSRPQPKPRWKEVSFRLRKIQHAYFDREPPERTSLLRAVQGSVLHWDLEDIDWSERAIRIQGKGDHSCEMFFSRCVSRYLDDYLKQRGQPTVGPLFITARKARSPRRADLTADGHARLSYRQADTLWKKYTPGWDLHQLRHTAISARAAHGYNEIELKRFSGYLSLRSLEVYIAHNREAAKSKARPWERRDQASR